MINYKKQKKGKGMKKKKIGLAEYESYVPDSKNFKTLQLRVTGWIKTDEDMTQHEFDKVQSSIKYRIKQLIYLEGRTNTLHKDVCIVDIDTPYLATGNKIKPRQYLKIDVVLFIKDDMKYDRYLVGLATDNKARQILGILKKYDEFQFVPNRIIEHADVGE